MKGGNVENVIDRVMNQRMSKYVQMMRIRRQGNNYIGNISGSSPTCLASARSMDSDQYNGNTFGDTGPCPCV